MSTLEQAIQLACRTHEGQLDLAGEPYILHVLRVVTTLQFHSGHDDQFRHDARIVAALHDVVEDSHDWLLSAVKDFVDELSVNASTAIYRLTRDRTEAYSKYIDLIAHDELATVVKIADLRDNLQPRRRPLNQAQGEIERRRVKYEKALLILAGESARRDLESL